MNIQLDTPSVTEALLQYKPQIEGALEHGAHSHSFDHIVLAVLDGRLHFYPLDNSFVIMEMQTYPNLNVYHCFLAGGKLTALTDAQEMIAENGKKLGCSKMTFIGRRGFTRALRDHGWKESRVQMEYPILGNDNY